MKRIYRRGKVQKECLNCLKFFEVRQSWSHVKYCSRKCWTKTRSGDKNPNWKGGITGQDQEERNRFNREVRDLVFQRDDYTCQVCYIRGVILNVDHIKPWAKYPDLRFSMENCRTLCRPCHYYVTFKRVIPAKSKWGLQIETGIKDLQ